METALVEKKCSVCESPTDLACSDCRIDLSTTVYVCAKSECRDEHERVCPSRLIEQYDKMVDRLKGCEEIAEGNEGWERIPLDCPSLAAVAELRLQLGR